MTASLFRTLGFVALIELTLATWMFGAVQSTHSVPAILSFFDRASRESPALAQDSAQVGRVSGVVSNASGSALANVIISLTPGDFRRTTDSTGVFAFEALRPGRYRIEARAIGRTPRLLQIDVVAGKTVTINVDLGDVQRLDTSFARGASSIWDRDLIAYNQRRLAHLGYAIDGEKLAKRSDSYSALSSLPGLLLTRRGNGVDATIGFHCKPLIFLDGIKTDLEMASALPTKQLRAIEVFTHPSDAPAEYHYYGGCGYIMFWSGRR